MIILDKSPAVPHIWVVKKHLKHITKDPLVKNGEPCIRGLPITVAEIMSCVLAGKSLKLILVEHPELTTDDFKACLAFVTDKL